MTVFTIKHTTEKKDFESIMPKVFASKKLANDYLQKLYDEYIEKAGEYINWSVITNNKEARIETNYGFDLFEIIEIEVEGNIHYLDEFCKDEASFRLKEVFGLTDEQINNIQKDIKDIIFDIVNYGELYDDMDEQIEKYLNTNNLINKDEEA